MKNKLFILLLVLGIIVIVGYVNSKKSSVLASNLTQSEYISKLNAALDQVISKSQAGANANKSSMHFSTNLFLAHGAFIKYIPQDILLKYVDVIKASGADRIDISPSPAFWTNNDKAMIAKYDAVVDRIRQDGLQLAIDPEFNRSDYKTTNFSEIQKSTLSAYQQIAQKYTPDIFVVLHEPTTMNMRLGIKASVKQWTNFVSESAKIVKQVSPETRIAAGGEYYESAYITPLFSLSSVDIITFNIYDVSKLKNYTSMALAAQKKGKSTYIEETWRTPYAGSTQGNLDIISMTGIGLKDYAALDQKWLKALTLYAKALNMEAITPFWSPTFFAYLSTGGNMTDPKYIGAVIEAIKNNKQTETYNTFKNLVGQYL